MHKQIRNQHGVLIYFDAAVQHMDDAIREDLHMELAPCTEEQFFNAYCEAHLQQFGEEFFLNGENPIW